MHIFLALVLCSQMYYVWSNCSHHPCPTDFTCCEAPSGGQGCCPIPDAVCCGDGLHCCPPGYDCDLKKSECVSKKQLMVPFIYGKSKTPPVVTLKASSMYEAQRVDVVYCPGGRSYCPDGTTCCILPSGSYGCCPYPLAMCCRDKVHCCPYGSICDASSQYCIHADTEQPVALKQLRFQALPVQEL